MRIPQTVYEVFEPGVYPATVASVEPVSGQFGDQLKVKFDLDGAGGHSLTVWTSLAFSQKSKLGQLAKAAFGGRDIPPDYVLDTDHLLGRRLRLLVTTEERSDGSTYNKVSQFMALAAGPAAASTPAPPAPPPAPRPAPADPFDGAPPYDERIPF